MTADELEEQVRATRALTQLRLAQRTHDHLFGEGAFLRDKEALVTLALSLQKVVPPEAVRQAIARTN